ncbi:MAG TPA: DNA mismatch repair protein MutS, partial [Kandleria vitulina]|nr:DNA mismatch repair protein MutS [Kandleria vitulina]
MAKKKEKYSPMMTKYLELKKDYQDSIVFYRLGDFYEMFFDDAIVASKALNIALTGKNAGVSERVPMCGVPFHSAQGYIEDLVKMGHKVVIVEQLTDPKASKGLVERGVVQIVTPGTIMDLKLNEKVNHFIGALGIFDFHYTLAYADISTGEFYCLNLEKDDRKLKNQIETLDLKELVMNQDGYEDDSLMISHYDNEHIQDKYKKLFEGVSDLKEIKVASNLLNYMLETQKRDLDYIQPLTEVDQQNYVVLDASTKKALELTKNSNQEKYGTLLWLLDHTHSAMGGRMLKSWIDHPLLNKDAIEERLDMVEIFVDNLIERETIKDMINEIYDIEKLASRIAFGNVNARDLKWIASSLQVIPELKHQLLSLENEKLNKLAEQLLDLTPITELIESAIVDNPPLVIKEGNIIKEGYSAELDEYRDAKKNGQNWLREFEEKEKQRTGIQKLKIGYNRVFGYYIEVTKSQLNLVKDEFNYTRKQSLTNAERFITPELKEMEDKILSAQDRIVSLEYEIFSQIRQYIKQYVHMIQDVAKVVAKVDVYISLAIVASSNRYVRPTFNDEHRLHIVEGKHPIVEEVISSKNYIANDVDLDEKNRIMMITGPNMGGKSTYMRQVTLTVLMAQMGSFVPAREADLPIFDQIFTRIGAS